MPQPQTYDEHAPAPALAGLVRTVWVQRIGELPYPQRDLPTGGVELQCPIGGVPRLVGPLTRAKVHVLPPRTTIVGVRFMPGAATPLLGLPADELVDLAVGLDDVWGTTAIAIAELLAYADSPDAALALLQGYLSTRLRRVGPTDGLVTEMVQQLMPWRPVEICTVADTLALSESQLRRRTLTAAGVGPKTLQRILRFQGYLALAQANGDRLNAGRGYGLAELAAMTGYADQAHLSRECLRLTGVSPRELLGDKADHCDCGHDHSASYRPFLAGLAGLTPAGRARAG